MKKMKCSCKTVGIPFQLDGKEGWWAECKHCGEVVEVS
jgi:hypothetical protein